MKIVFTKDEVANALSMSLAEFEQCRLELEAISFPRPIAGLHERWSIIDVVNWVNRSGTSRLPRRSLSDSPAGPRLN
jgi:hypothetical protein